MKGLRNKLSQISTNIFIRMSTHYTIGASGSKYLLEISSNPKDLYSKKISKYFEQGRAKFYPGLSCVTTVDAL